MIALGLIPPLGLGLGDSPRGRLVKGREGPSTDARRVVPLRPGEGGGWSPDALLGLESDWDGRRGVDGGWL